MCRASSLVVSAVAALSLAGLSARAEDKPAEPAKAAEGSVDAKPAEGSAAAPTAPAKPAAPALSFANAPAMIAHFDKLKGLLDEARDRVREKGGQDDTVLDVEAIRNALGDLKDALKAVIENKPNSDLLTVIGKAVQAVGEANQAVVGKLSALKLPDVEKACEETAAFVTAGHALVKKLRAALAKKD